MPDARVPKPAGECRRRVRVVVRALPYRAIAVPAV